LRPLLRSVARRLLLCIAVAAIAVLALRSAVGPFQLWGFHTPVNSPFVAENLFWMAVFGLLCLGLPSGIALNPNENDTAGIPRIHLALVLCVVALAFARNLADPFLSDDYIIVSGPAFHWQTFVAALHRPGGDGSFRPLGTVYYQLLITFAGKGPLNWHVVGLALHLLNVALVFAIAWRLWRDKAAAVVSSLVFGLNGTRPEAALWTAGNCDLLACACVLGSIGLVLSTRARLRLVAGLVLVAAGVLFKESAYAMPLIAFWILRSRGPVRNLRNFLIGSCAVCGALFAWRWRLFHGPGGYIDRATGQPAILSLHPLAAAKAVFLRMWAILLTPVDWDASQSWWLPLAIVFSLAAVLLLAAHSRAGAALRTHLCLIAAACCAVLPAIHLALIGQSALGSRILYLPAAPFALLIGCLTLGAGKRTIVVAAVMIAGMAGILEHNLTAWHKAALQARALCRDATAQPGKSVPGTVEGVFLFQNGYPECIVAARILK